ncbi:MAG TPA: SRPBCC domain-containing protein, partial [Chitinophagaceae bacterium]|nr:SRPBCC domain-containing protein [Chitinophagaceae bacterium]
WRYDGYPGESLVTFELFDEGEKTRLRLTHSGLETFPSDNPSFKKENFAAGWSEIIGTSLKDYLEKNSTLAITG